MALTKITGDVIATNTSITAVGATFTGNVSIAGTISYEDVTNVDSVGLITARSGINITSGGLIVTGVSTVSAGSTSAPSISPSGDTNTGIFFPSADTIAFGEGGSEVLRIDSSGRLLVGTSTARSNFFGTTLSSLTQTEGTGGSTARGALSVINNDVSNNPAYVLLGRSGAATLGSNAAVVSGSRLGTLTFHGADGTSFIEAATVAGEVDGTPGTSDMPGRLVFSTTSDNAGSPTERMRLDSSGGFQFKGAGTAGVTQAVSFNGSAPVNSLVIDSSGRVGLGTSSPGALLHLSATAGNQELRLSDTTNTAMGRMYVANGTYLISETAHPIVFQTNATNRMTIDSSGNVNIDSNTLYVDATNNRVGIGATTVGDLLHLRAATTPHLRIDHTTTSSFGAVQFYEDTTQQASIGALGSTSSGTGGGNALQIWNFLNAPTVFATNNQERARIDSSGRLLVGTSSSRAIYGISSAIQIEGTGFDTSSLSLICNNNGSQSAYLALGRTRGTSVGSTTTIANGDILGAVSFTGAHNSGLTGASASITGYVDGTPGANDIPGRLEFSTTADGASSPTERMRINSNGIIQARNGAGDTLNLYNAVSAGTSSGFIYGVHSSTSAYNGTTSFVVYTNGNVVNTNGSYTTLSDVRLKENIVDAGSQWDDLKAIRIRNWNFKEETGHETHRQIGPIAQELEQVCPGLVFDTPDRDADGNKTGEVTKGVNQSVLYMKAVKALQEAMERIEQLEASNADLLARVTALES
jgi:hypothetical protein